MIMAEMIKYNYPVSQLDDLIQKIEQGIEPMMTQDLANEVKLRMQELQHQIDDDGDYDEEFQNAVEKHKDVMKKIEEERRKARSRNIVELDLTEEELAEIHDGCSVMYVRNDPNSSYNIAESSLAKNAEEAAIKKRLESLGKVYYHQEDYRAAIMTIRDAIEYSLKNEYPWMTYQQAVEAFRKGNIKYCFGDIPILYIGFDKQITDPKILSGIVTGDVTLVDEEDTKPKRKKKKCTTGVPVNVQIIGPEEHKQYVNMHNAGYNTPISLMLKASSTMYNRYVMPPGSSWSNGGQQGQNDFFVDWGVEGAGDAYYERIHGIKHNQTNEIIAALQAANDRGLNQVIGDSLRQFPQLWEGKPEPQKFVLSTSLEENKEAVQIEQNILNLIRNNNPNI